MQRGNEDQSEHGEQEEASPALRGENMNSVMCAERVVFTLKHGEGMWKIMAPSKWSYQSEYKYFRGFEEYLRLVTDCDKMILGWPSIRVQCWAKDALWGNCLCCCYRNIYVVGTLLCRHRKDLNIRQHSHRSAWFTVWGTFLFEQNVAPYNQYSINGWGTQSARSGSSNSGKEHFKC